MKKLRGSDIRGVALLVGVALAAVLVAGSAVRAQDAPKMKRVPLSAEHARLSAGAELFATLCASCHGPGGRGDGPVAPALKTAAPDLTRLAQQNGGEFPALRVKNAILGIHQVAAHGSSEMPVWGDVFSRTLHSAAIAELHANALTQHIESLQAKSEE